MFSIKVLILVLCFVFSESKLLKNESYYRLPSQIVPHHYDLNFDVRLEPEFEFNGTVIIDLTVVEVTNTIVLHSEDLDIQRENVFLRDINSELIKVSSLVINPINNFLKLKFNENIEPGNFTLEFSFNGNLTSFPGGLYLSKYTLNGTEKFIASTQLEATNARRMFPCFDEPHLKSTFKLKVRHPSDRFAISNGMIENTETNNETTTTYFQNSPYMSTYLLALAITDFETLEFTQQNKKYRIYTPPGLQNYTTYAHEITFKSIKYLEEILKVEYSLPKLDQISIPEYSGGMENWGLIVYSPQILYKANASSLSEKDSTLILVCHEIAHQWFGNLVTLKWWDHVWLNEGFATYYGTMIADQIEPSRRIQDFYMVKTVHGVLISDSDPIKSRALNEPVLAQVDILKKFDSFSYNKGAAIIRFMDSIFTNFTTSIQNYLKFYSFKSVTQNDLFEKISESNTLPNGLSIYKVLKSWTNQKGYPVITLTRNYDTGMATLSQKRFIQNPSNITYDEKWWIPVTMSEERNPIFNNKNHPIDWLKPSDENIEIKVETKGWTILNIQQKVLCRVNYDLVNWQMISNYLNSTDFQKIHHLNRAQLIDDSMKLARANELNYEVALNISSFLHREQDQVVWITANANFYFLYNILRGTDIQYKFYHYITQLMIKANAAGALKKFKSHNDIGKENYSVRKFKKVIGKMKTNSLKQKGWEKIFDDLSENVFTLEEYSQIPQILNENENLMKGFVKDLSDTTIKRIEENILYKIQWIDNYYDIFKTWLERQGF